MSLRIGSLLIAGSGGSASGGVDVDLSNISQAGQQVINLAYPTFQVNSGSVDASTGEFNFLTCSGTLVRAAAPFVFTTASGKTYKVTEDLTFNFDSLLNTVTMEIFVLVNPNTNEPEIYTDSPTVVKSKIAPEDTSALWVNTSVFPNLTYKYSSGDWHEIDLVPIGTTTIEAGYIEEEEPPF